MELGTGNMDLDSLMVPVYDDKTGNLDRYNIFTAILLIKHSEDGNKYLHDITTIKKETSSPLES